MIPISSCDSCNPKVWKKGKEAVGVYLCQKCKKTVRFVLEKLSQHISTDQETNKLGQGV